MYMLPCYIHIYRKWCFSFHSNRIFQPAHTKIDVATLLNVYMTFISFVFFYFLFRFWTTKKRNYGRMPSERKEESEERRTIFELYKAKSLDYFITFIWYYYHFPPHTVCLCVKQDFVSLVFNDPQVRRVIS